MKKHRWIVTSLFAVALVAIGTGMQGRTAAPSFVDVRGYILPAHQVVRFGNGLVRFDTRTGAMSLLRGDPGVAASSATCTWAQRVAPVKEPHSGLLEIQTPEGPGASYFLVDVREGATWVLRWRGNQNGSWVLVKDAP